MEILKIVADNPALFSALKKVISDEFQDEGMISINSTTNETLGAITRARLDGLRKVEVAFKKIAQHKTLPEGVDKINQAR